MAIRDKRRRTDPEGPVRKSKWNRNHERLAAVMKQFPGGSPGQYAAACQFSENVFRKTYTEDFRAAFGLEDRLGLDSEKALVKSKAELRKGPLRGSKMELVVKIDEEIRKQELADNPDLEEERGLLFHWAKWVRADPGAARHVMDQLVGRPDAKIEVKVENEVIMGVVGELLGEYLGKDAIPALVELQRRIQVMTDPAIDAEYTEP